MRQSTLGGMRHYFEQAEQGDRERHQKSTRRPGRMRELGTRFVDAVAITCRRAGFAEAGGVSPYTTDKH